MATTTFSADPAIRNLQDRADITDVLYRYASTIDRFDLEGLRGTLADDLRAQYGNADGDRASALVYHTSYQGFEDSPDTAKLLVGRYHNELRREAGGWKISRLVLEILWGEEKADAAGYLAAIGGRGPQA